MTHSPSPLLLPPPPLATPFSRNGTRPSSSTFANPVGLPPSTRSRAANSFSPYPFGRPGLFGVHRPRFFSFVRSLSASLCLHFSPLLSLWYLKIVRHHHAPHDHTQGQALGSTPKPQKLARRLDIISKGSKRTPIFSFFSRVCESIPLPSLFLCFLHSSHPSPLHRIFSLVSRFFLFLPLSPARDELNSHQSSSLLSRPFACPPILLPLCCHSSRIREDSRKEMKPQPHPYNPLTIYCTHPLSPSAPSLFLRDDLDVLLSFSLSHVLCRGSLAKLFSRWVSGKVGKGPW